MLLIFISKEAWLTTEWLLPGLALWTEGPLETKRDHFLPLPSLGLDAATNRRALYSDCAGFSRALWASLAAEDGTALLPQEAGRYSWTSWALLDRTLRTSWA